MFKIAIGNSCTINAKFTTIRSCFFDEDAEIVKKLINMIHLDEVVSQRVRGVDYRIEDVGVQHGY